MAMDIISGIVLVTSALILGITITGAFAAHATGNRQDNHISQEIFSGMRGIQGTLVVVYFVATTHLLLIAQQLSLALGNFVVGLILIVVMFIEPALRGGHQPPSERDNWRK